jgi:UDP-N-acetylmuramyl pentapeptide phosphotransferase/UDP-N-acetylglucosamine-1-phosphate transferase
LNQRDTRFRGIAAALAVVALTAPAAHHFELSGWAETTIVVRFWLLAGMFVLVGLWVFYRSGAAGLR